MSRTLILSAAAVAFCCLAAEVRRIDGTLSGLAREPVVEPGRVVRLERDLGQALVGSERELAAERAERERLERRLDMLALALGESAGMVARLRSKLESWECSWGEREPEALEREIAALRGELEQRSHTLAELAEGAARRVSEEGERLTELRSRIDGLDRGRDVDGMWREIVGPVVQLAGDATVGSGVLLESRPRPEGGFTTYMVTSWHVVRDIYGSPERVATPVPVRIYLPEGGLRRETASMVAYDVPLDVALLVLDTEVAVPCGARLASRERVAGVRIFDPVYAVGCPLGNDPIPTAGEIAATQHEVDGARYWMISAPTYIGNSGGGIFDAQTHELVGIFSKIYTHGAMRSTIVPHMGLATPLSMIYGWLDEVGQSQVVDLQVPHPIGGAEAQPASMARN
jgi:S1-C subfamily serine protease